jgi:hypothetical protein
VTTIKNISNGPHDVKTLDQGLQRLQPGESLTATFERTYLRLLRNGRSFEVSDGEGETVVQGGQEASGGATGAGGDANQTEHRQNGSGDPEQPADDSTDKEAWVAYATFKGIDVKKSWGINRIKTELEQLG